LHVRRTDFVNHKYHDCVDLNYYKNSIDLILSKVKDPFFYVFSDYILWCEENLPLNDYNRKFVDNSFNGDKCKYYFKLMTSCKHYIIPNSSFGWWAAWLNNMQNKTVVCPKMWFTDPLVNTKDLIPEEWIRL